MTEHLAVSCGETLRRLEAYAIDAKADLACLMRDGRKLCFSLGVDSANTRYAIESILEVDSALTFALDKLTELHHEANTLLPNDTVTTASGGDKTQPG